MSNLYHIIKLQDYVINSMENKDLYVGLTKDEISNIILKDGLMLGAFLDKSLIAVYAIFFPGISECNLGYDLELHELLQVAHIEALFVHPEYRGFSISKKLGKQSIELAKKMRDIKYICETISPFNYSSLSNAFSLELYIKGIKHKYGGLLRYILVRNCFSDEIIDPHTLVCTSTKDIENQKKLLSNGYIGTNYTLIDNQMYITFYKTLS